MSRRAQASRLRDREKGLEGWVELNLLEVDMLIVHVLRDSRFLPVRRRGSDNMRSTVNDRPGKSNSYPARRWQM